MTKAKAHDIDDVPVSGGQEKRRRVQDQVDLMELPAKKWATMRALPGVYSYGGHWIVTKKRDGKKGSFYIPCAAWDPETAQRQGGDGRHHCHFCALEAFYRDNDVPKDDRMSRFTTDHYTNVISRALQRKAPQENDISEAEAESGFKDKESESWTPVRVLRLTDNMVRQLRAIRELNVHEGPDGETKSYPAADKRFGCDFMIKHDPDAPAASRYSTNKGEHKPLLKSEARYLVWDLSDLQDIPTKEESERELKSWARRLENDYVNQFLGEDGEEAPKKPSKKAKPAEDEDDFGEEEAPPRKPASKKPSRPPADEDDFGEEEDNEPPARKPSGKKTRDVDEDDFEDADDTPPARKPARKPQRQVEEDDFEDDAEEEAPPRKPAGKKPASPAVDEDDDFGEEEEPPRKPTGKKPSRRAAEEEVEDDFEEEPPARKPAGKKPSRPQVDEDDDFGEEEPPARKPAKRPSKPSLDDDDFGDADDDMPVRKSASKKPSRPTVDEDDFEEEPPARKPAKKPAARRPVADDDFDD